MGRMKLQDERRSNYYERGFSTRGKEETKDVRRRTRKREEKRRLEEEKKKQEKELKQKQGEKER